MATQTYQSSGVVVVQVHHGSDALVLAPGCPFGRVDERLGELHAVTNVVGTASPLPALGTGVAGR